MIRSEGPQAWAVATRQGDLLDEPAPLAHLMPSTPASYATAYGQLLTFLQRQKALHPDEAPMARVTRERILAYVEGTRERVAPQTLRDPGARRLPRHQGLGIQGRLSVAQAPRGPRRAEHEAGPGQAPSPALAGRTGRRRPAAHGRDDTCWQTRALGSLFYTPRRHSVFSFSIKLLCRSSSRFGVHSGLFKT